MAGIFYKMSVLTIPQYFFMLLGYAMIFISGVVWAAKVMKAKTSAALENILRMLIILVAAVPATGVMNFLVSVTILVACQGMMNGREI